MSRPINDPDLTNENPEYWEQVLASHGLSMKRGHHPNKIALAGSTSALGNLSGAADLRTTELGGNGLGFDVRKTEPKGSGPDSDN